MVKRFYYGWVCVGAGFLIQFLYGVHYAFGLFLEPVAGTFACSRVAISVAPALMYGVAIAARLVWGRMLDVYGARLTFALSCLLGGAGLILSGLTRELWQFNLTYGVLWGAGWSAFFFTSSGVIRRWFAKKAGLALGIAGCGTPFGWLVVLPLAGYLISRFGWRGAFSLLGALTCLVGLVTAVVVKNAPEDIGLAPDGGIPEPASAQEGGAVPGAVDWEVGEAIHSRSFWFMGLVTFGLLAGLTIITVHGVAYCVERGIARETATYIFGIMGLLALPGKLGGGLSGDYLVRRGMAAVHARRYMLALSGLLMGVGIIILLRLAGPGWLWAWALAFGIGYGIHGPQMGAIIGDMFGRKNIGLLMTLISGTAGGLGGLVSPVLAGWTYDLTGNYQAALQLAILFCTLAVIFSVLITTPRKA